MVGRSTLGRAFFLKYVKYIQKVTAPSGSGAMFATARIVRIARAMNSGVGLGMKAQSRWIPGQARDDRIGCVGSSLRSARDDSGVVSHALSAFIRVQLRFFARFRFSLRAHHLPFVFRISPRLCAAARTRFRSRSPGPGLIKYTAYLSPFPEEARP